MYTPISIMVTKQKLININIVQQIVYNHNTMDVDEIRSIMQQKEGGPVFSRVSIWRYLQDIRTSTEEWINMEAKSGYLQTVRQLLLSKKTRLTTLTRLFNSEQTPPKIKSDIAGRMTETEESIRYLMESLPLLAQFNAVMNGTNNNNNNNHYELNQNAVIIRD